MVMHDYAPHFEREPEYELSAAGWFWFAYMLGANTVMGALIVYGYWEQIKQGVGL